MEQGGVKNLDVNTEMITVFQMGMLLLDVCVLKFQNLMLKVLSYICVSSLALFKNNIYIFFVFSGLHPWHAEVPRLGRELMPQQPKLLQRQCQILKLLCHKGTPQAF